MSGVDFADRYAQAHLRPTPEIMAARQASAARIQDDADKAQLLDLVAAYYGLRPDLTWFRDELREDDATFSLVSGERESVVLAALILAAKIGEGDPTSILGVVAGSVHGRRAPTEAAWLVADARSSLAEHAVAGRVPQDAGAPIRYGSTPKLAEEIAAAAASGLETVAQALAKVRNESQAAVQHIANQMTEALSVLDGNARLQREESQILWWLFGEHSRALDTPFSAFRPPQAALIGGVELAALSDASDLGPVAAQAVLERVLRGAKRDGKGQPVTLLGAVDGLAAVIAKLGAPAPARAGICPVLTAIAKADEIGSSAWAGAFERATGLQAAMELSPIELAVQVYHECLLGRVE